VRILTINCGSSILKFDLFDAADWERSIARGVVDRIGGRGSAELISESGERKLRSIAAADHGEATHQAIRLLDSSGFFGTLDAVGHRVVHGGARFSGPVLLDAEAEVAIEEFAELAPLHNGPPWQRSEPSGRHWGRGCRR
jgi:acetate kinase